MGWFTDWLGEFFTFLYANYKTEILTILAFLFLFSIRKYLGNIFDGMEKVFKDNVIYFLTFICSVLVFMTLDDPIIDISVGWYFLIGVLLVLTTFSKFIAKEAHNIYEDKIKPS